jgi:hypothetical protein
MIARPPVMIQSTSRSAHQRENAAR